MFRALHYLETPNSDSKLDITLINHNRSWSFKFDAFMEDANDPYLIRRRSAMSSQLKVADLAHRLNSFPYDRYLYIGSFMRSVAWAAGTIVLLAILRNRTIYLPRLLPWIVSFLATMVTLMTWGRGVLFTNSRANLWDSILPTLMGILEFCLFAVLAPPELFGGDTSANAFDSATLLGRVFNNLNAWHFWFFVLAAHSSVAVALVA